ncbi:hypothetical protein AMATHDRAFT_74077 [Amanita thiersii Skay4041]|uniref:Sodium/calcium exchanger membrane region domain-containing protein n=1 Tax=Amanita thiersii Skay4041 TaxID=703135 RepID=A0A2A9NPX7_9AGAR|nr:hypothetical protein AMATHDRAFT_74077 [Amanita thiersii Skay4041]
MANPGSPPLPRQQSSAPWMASEPLRSASSHDLRIQAHENSEAALSNFWDRFTRRGKENVGVRQSLKAIVFSSFCFLAIIPLERLFDYGGEQMTFYLGKELGDLLVITLNNAVEATLAIILLLRRELKLLQSTIVGVVILHLLLIPGTSFIIGGARIMHQHLHPHFTQLNQTLLTIGVLSLLLPAAYFGALDRAAITSEFLERQPVLSDDSRDTFLVLSRGISVVLLVVYVCSRIFLHNPPGPDDLEDQGGAEQSSGVHKPEAGPEVNQYICIIMLIISIGLMAATAEWLVEAVEPVREDGHIKEEWFGLILLPFLSFAADGVVAVVYFLRFLVRYFFKGPEPPNIQAKARAIDLSIQFMLFWMPFFVLLGWWTNRPLSLLFDFFEIAILIGACFIVNYVTADSKTNWAEGLGMVSFYVMIAICAWFYPGQPEIQAMLFDGPIAEGIASVTSGVTEHH